LVVVGSTVGGHERGVGAGARSWRRTEAAGAVRRIQVTGPRRLKTFELLTANGQKPARRFPPMLQSLRHSPLLLTLSVKGTPARQHRPLAALQSSAIKFDTTT
jgi:hypothetical protein